MKKQSQVRTFVRGIRSLCTLEGAVMKRARSITADDLGWIDDAALLIENGKILAVGRERDLLKKATVKKWLARRSKEDEIREIDVQGRIVTPSFTECHTHLIYAGNRAGEFERRNQGESYQSIAKSGGGILATVLPTREALEKDLVRIGQARADRYIRQGVTTIEAKSGYGLNLETEFKLLRASKKVKRARIVTTFLGAHAVPKDFTNADDYIDYLIREAFPRLKEQGETKRVDIFVEDGYFNRDQARRYMRAAKQYGFDLVVHADQLTLSGGAKLAVDLEARSADHLIQIQSPEIRKLAKSEVSCVLLPSADLYMKCAYPPARRLIEAGARVALATDLNPGTSPSQDIALVGLLARLEMKMTLPEVFVAYTLGAAYALGLGDRLGALVPGRQADFCVLSDGFDDLFLEIGRTPVESVYRDGEKLW